MSGLAPAPAPAWVPTHVQVTVLRARGLRAKAAGGAGGGSDAYAVMALGRDKFSTSVAERCQGQPLWREEATFELPPPPRPAALRLTVLHRALVGLDKFLGRAEVDLAALRADGGRRHTRWYKLRSKPGKKEKERGEIEVDIQFMRSNMTASMFDLSVKDKSRSPFGKLKDKLKGKRSSGLSDTASAIVPSTAHSSADSEDESVEKEKKKSKFKTLFSKPGLQKNSLSQSMSVLPTQQPVTERVRLRPSDFQSQWDDEECESSSASEKAFGNALEEKSSPSPVFRSRKTVALDRQLHPGPTSHTKREGLSLFSGLKSKSDPVSKSSLCINGSHVYMEESVAKDNTPASSPSPHNFRRKQLFSSEENLSSRSPKGPEETGRTSPSHAFSGSASLETFKSMTLPSYKLLSSEEYLETSVPPSVEVLKETKKPDHKKSTLLSLVTGKKEAAKTSDAENIPDRTLQDEENKVPEEKSEQEAKHLELPADLSRGNPSEDDHRREDHIMANKQPLNPFEDEQKPEKAAAPSKTKAVKPRLSMSSEEETKATLPTLAPESLPTFLPAPRVSSGNNPFISETGPKAQVPGPDITSSPTSLASPPPFAAELFTGSNPFAAGWGRAPTASAPRAPVPGQLSGSTNNPFASEWGQSCWAQGAESSDRRASRGPSGPPAPSLPSDCRLAGNNPFLAELGGEAGAAGSKAVVSSSPPCPPRAGDRSSAELGPSARPAAGTSSDVVFTGDVKAASNPPSTRSDHPGLAPEQQCESPQLWVEDSVESSKLGSRKSVSFLLGGLEGVTSGDEDVGGQEREQQDLGLSRVLLTGSAAAGERAGFGPELETGCCPPSNLSGGREVFVAPKPAPRLSVMLECPPASPAAGLSGDGVKPAPGPPDGKGPDAYGHLPQSSSLEPVPPPVALGDSSSKGHLTGDSSSKGHLTGDSSSKGRLTGEGGDDFLDCLSDPKSAIPLTGDRSLKRAGLPAIPEGGSDDELLGDCGVAAGEQNVSETAERSFNLIPLHAGLKGHSGSSAAARVTPAAPGGVCELSRAVLPARVDALSASNPVAVTSHSREHSSCFEKRELEASAGVEERAECDFFEPSVSPSSLSSPSQPYSSSYSLPSDAQSRRAESPKKPTAEGSADKAGNSGKKKLLQARVSPSEAYPNLGQQSGETLAPKHRLHPVKPMSAPATKAPSKSLNVISTMNEKLLEMNVKKYDPSEPGYAYAQLTHDELIQLVLRQKDTITRKDLQVRELEDYIDNLLVRVMEETPNILRVSTSGNKKAGKM